MRTSLNPQKIRPWFLLCADVCSFYEAKNYHLFKVNKHKIEQCSAGQIVYAGITMLNNIIDNHKQYDQHNIVFNPVFINLRQPWRVLHARYLQPNGNTSLFSVSGKYISAYRMFQFFRRNQTSRISYQNINNMKLKKKMLTMMCILMTSFLLLENKRNTWPGNKV